MNTIFNNIIIIKDNEQRMIGFEVLDVEERLIKKYIELRGNKYLEIDKMYNLYGDIIYNNVDSNMDDCNILIQNKHSNDRRYEYIHSNNYLYYFINPDTTDLIIEELCDEKGKVYFTKYKNGKIKTYFK